MQNVIDTYTDLQGKSSKQAGKSSPLEFKITNNPKKVTINILQRKQPSDSSTRYLVCWSLAHRKINWGRLQGLQFAIPILHQERHSQAPGDVHVEMAVQHMQMELRGARPSKASVRCPQLEMHYRYTETGHGTRATAS